MTGHNNSIQSPNPSFLTTLQATLDILDDVSGAIPENTYLTLTNNLQQLYTIHTSTSTLNPTLNPTSYANPPITTPINYTRTDYISNTSYASISNFDISYASLSNFDISNANTNANINANNNANNNIITNINNNANNNENIQSRIQSLNEESNRIGYSTRTRLALYNNVFNA